MFDKGWTGRHVLLMNVIDREMMDWHKENKHTALVSRQIGVGKDGTLFPEVGVPSYGFVGALGNLFKFYKSWEKYDIGITRTGLMETPYRVVNASKYFEEIPESKRTLISDQPLTDEEREFERYDLKTLFKFTNYTKIYNHLKGKIARIDAVLGTNFLSEMKHQVDLEKEEYSEMKANETLNDIKDTVTGEQPVAGAPSEETTKVVQRERTVVKGNDFSNLEGWKGLTQEEKDGITNVDLSTTPITIEYADKDAVLLACPECKTPGPETFGSCAACGLEF